MNERKRGYCKVDKREMVFMRTYDGFWLCAGCMFRCSSIGDYEVKGGDKEDE